MQTYNILWLDDEPQKLQGFVNESNLEGFNLENFQTSSEAIDELVSNHHKYDGIILDVLGKKKSSNEQERQAALIDFLTNRPDASKDIPFVILTGQPDLIGDADLADTCNIDPKDIFFKEDDADPLYERLRELIQERPYARVRKYHSEILTFLNTDSFKPSDYDNFVEILDSASRAKVVNSLPFGAMRVILDGAMESLFQDAFLRGYENEELLRRGSIISGNCQKLLKGFPLKHSRSGRGVRLKNGAKVPLLISIMMEQIYGLGSNEVHNPGSENWPYDLAVAKGFASKISLLRSTSQNLCVVLEYFLNHLSISQSLFEIETRDDSYVDKFTRKGNFFNSSWGRDFAPDFRNVACYSSLRSRFTEGKSFKVEVNYIRGAYQTSGSISDYTQI